MVRCYGLPPVSSGASCGLLTTLTWRSGRKRPRCIGTLTPVTDDLDVYFHPTQGFSSETLSFTASQVINANKRETFIYQVGDFDPHGMEIWQCVIDRLSELVHVPVHFERLAATVEDRDEYIDFAHPVKRPKNDARRPCFANRETHRRVRRHGA